MVDASIGRVGWIGKLAHAGYGTGDYYMCFANCALAEFGKEELKVVGQW